MTTYAVAESGPVLLATEVVERVEIARLTLCGSTRFRAEYELWNKRLTLAGFLVYSVSGFGHSGDTFTDEEKQRLDQIHLAKIDAAHAIVVINPEGYIGDSTRREIEHAQRTGKRVYYTHVGMPTVYQLRTGPDGGGSLRYRAFDYASTPIEDDTPTVTGQAVGDTAPSEITYNPVYKVTYEDADPTRGYVYRLAHPTPTNGLLSELVEGFVASLTSKGTNRGNCITINHDELRALISRTALAKVKAVEGDRG